MRFELIRVGDRWQFVRDGAVVSEHGPTRARDAYMLALDALVAAATPVRALLAAGTEDTAADPEAGLLPEHWEGAPAVAYNAPTGDGRDLTDCTFTWRDPSAGIVPLMLQVENQGGHFGAVLAGLVEQFSKVPIGVTAAGRFYDSPEGARFRDMLLGGRKFGVSVDGGAMEVEWECVRMNEDEGWCEEEVAHVHALELIGLTGCGMPAFAEAAIALTGDTPAPAVADETPTPAAETVPAVAAAAGPLRPPRSWFDKAEPDVGDPDLVPVLVGEHFDEMTWAVPDVVITADGQFYGHLAVWGTCHIGYPGMCVTPPDSPTGYAHFNKFSTTVEDGTRVGTGPLVVGCDHAAARLLADAARDHYAHNGLAWGDARVTAGKYGIWAAGAVRPGVSDEALAAISRSGLSGDWRDIGGSLELIAALTVPTPGFPMVRLEALAAAAGLGSFRTPRPAAYVAGGVQLSLVAAGRPHRCPDCAETAALGRPVRRQDGMRQVLEELRAHRRLLAELERRTRIGAREHALGRVSAALGRIPG